MATNLSAVQFGIDGAPYNLPGGWTAVTFVGKASTLAAVNPVDVTFTLTSEPDGSSITLDDSGATECTFTPTHEGTHVVTVANGTHCTRVVKVLALPAVLLTRRPLASVNWLSHGQTDAPRAEGDAQLIVQRIVNDARCDSAALATLAAGNLWAPEDLRAFGA